MTPKRVRIRLIGDIRRLYELLGSKAVYFDRQRQGWRAATQDSDGTFIVVLARGTKYQQAVVIPREAIAEVREK